MAHMLPPLDLPLSSKSVYKIRDVTVCLKKIFTCLTLTFDDNLKTYFGLPPSSFTFKAILK